MLSFAYGVYCSLFADDTYKVLIIGLESSGKTTLVEHIRYIYAGSKGTGAVDAPRPPSANEIAKVRIQPTVGLNMSRLTHRTRRALPRTVGSTHLGDGSEKATAPHFSFSSSSSHEALPGETGGTAGGESAPDTHFVPLLTNLMFWDVGGSMRSLWANYFGVCHAVIYVVDSTLGAESNLSRFSTPPPAASTSHDTDDNATPLPLPCSSNSESRVAARRRAFEETAAVLRALFRHPLLDDAPLLILSNKADVADHCSLAEVQDALGFIDMALMPLAYEGEESPVRREAPRAHSENISSSAEAPGELSASASSRVSRPRGVTGERERGTSGIGKKIMRLMEASARDGTGLCEAMDWLVQQLRESRRETAEVDG